MGHQTAVNRREGRGRERRRQEGSFLCADVAGSPRHIKHKKQGAEEWVCKLSDKQRVVMVNIFSSVVYKCIWKF